MEVPVEDMAKKIVDLEAELDWWKVEEVKLKEQVMEVKGEEARMKEKYVEIREEFDSEKMKWRKGNERITEKYWELEVMKRELAIDLEAALSRQRGGDEGAAEPEVEHLKCLLEERDGEIKKLSGKIEALDRKKLWSNSLESDFRDKMDMEAKKTKREEEKNSKLIQKIQALERDKGQMAAEISKLRKEKREEVGKSFISAKKVVEAEKKRTKNSKGKHFELAKKIGEYEKEKKAMQDEVFRLNREKSEEVEKILKEKLAVEAEKRACEEMVVNLVKKNEASEKEKKEMEAKLSQADMEKDAEIKRILKEQTALKEEEHKMTLEREQYIEILYQENKTLEAQLKQLEMENIRLSIKREE